MTATTPVPGTEPTIDELRDRLEIMELTSQLVLSVDARDWSAAERLFSDVVDVDYTSLLGGEPQSVRAGELIGGWRQALGPLEATQHLVGNHVITVAGDEATCAANVQATHVLPNATGGPVWTVGGRYDFRLAHVSSGWRISAMTFVLKWATGNQHVMELAAAAASSGSPAR